MKAVLSKNRVMILAQKAAETAGLDPTTARPFELVLVAELKTSTGDYVLKINGQSMTDYIRDVEERMEDRDAFIAIGIAVGILPAKIDGNANVHTTAQPVQYFPDANVFDEAANAGGLSEKEALEAIYHGRITFKTNQGVRIDKAPMYHLRTVPQTQNGNDTEAMYDGYEVKEIGAAVRFGGGDRNSIQISINCHDLSKITGKADTRKNLLVVRLVGAVLRGQTTKQYLAQ